MIHVKAAATVTLLSGASTVCHTLVSHLQISVYFGCTGLSLEAGSRLTLRCSGQASPSGGLSACGVRALELGSFSSCGTWAQRVWAP